MVDAGVFERRLAKLEELVADLRPLAEMEKGDFLADHTAKSLAERWTHLAMECALDLAHHLIAVRGWSSPTTYRETFQILARHGVLTPELATQMEGWGGASQRSGASLLGHQSRDSFQHLEWRAGPD